jgi:NAD(P)-dependent dehydrogenase (short-subunit alcohol dehydrogenase family)
MESSIIVTGGTGALGTAVVRHLVGRGHRVAGFDSARSEDRQKALREELGERYLGILADVSTTAGWEHALDRATAQLGPVAGAVLTVGGWAGGAPLTSEAADVHSRMIASNLDTVHLALRALLPAMVGARRGSIVVIGSRAVERPWTSANSASYAASKAGAVALAQAVAAEVLESGVRINAVLPSTIDTAANRTAMPDADPARWVSGESLAKVIAFLLSDDSRDISGAAVPVYGRS